MKFTGPGRNVHERIIAQYHIIANDNIASEAIGLNYRGFIASLHVGDAATNTLMGSQSAVVGATMGQAAVIGHTGACAIAYPLGIIYSDMIQGVDVDSWSAASMPYRQSIWTNVLLYGYTDRIVVDGTTYVSTDAYLFDQGSDFGVCTTVSQAEVDSMNTMSGIFTFDGAPGAGETINMDGTATAAGTWTTPPITVRASGKVAPSRGFVGYKRGDFTIKRLREAGPGANAVLLAFGGAGAVLYQETEGFVMMLGQSPRG